MLRLSLDALFSLMRLFAHSLDRYYCLKNLNSPDSPRRDAMEASSHNGTPVISSPPSVAPVVHRAGGVMVWFLLIQPPPASTPPTPTLEVPTNESIPLPSPPPNEVDTPLPSPTPSPCHRRKFYVSIIDGSKLCTNGYDNEGDMVFNSRRMLRICPT